MLRILVLNLAVLLHPVHVSITTLSQDAESDCLKVMFRMYIDDFQLDYKLFHPGFKPGTGSEGSDYPHDMLNKYFNDRVQIYINNKLLPGKLTDVSINEYEILMNFEFESNAKPRSFRIRNQILTRVYSDQANMIYLNINKYEDAIKLTVDDTEAGIRLK